MSGFDPLSETLTLPAWAAGALLALVVILGVLAVVRGGWQTAAGSFAQFAAVIGLLFLAWTYFDRMTTRDAAEERRAYQARLADLNARTMVPQSALACLDALAGDALDEVCEKAVFANPESVAAAVSLMAARLSLLRDAVALARSGDTSYEHSIADLRRSIEMDRFGFAAQALAAREQCTPASCAALSLLKNPDRVAANLKDRTFDIHVGRHVAAWLSRSPGPAVASAPAAGGTHAAVTPATSAVNIDFPSAASIPPVSIMNNEPAAAPPSAADADAKPAAAPRRATSAPPAVPTPRAAARGGNAAPSTSAQ